MHLGEIKYVQSLKVGSSERKRKGNCQHCNHFTRITANISKNFQRLCKACKLSQAHRCYLELISPMGRAGDKKPSVSMAVNFHPLDNTNFTLSPSYSFHKSLYHKSCFLSLFIFRGHSTWEPASSRVTFFILRAYTGTGVSHSQHRKKSGEVLEKNAREWTRWVEISREEIPGSKRSMYMATY